MQAPREDSGYSVRVRFGRYVLRRLKRSKLDALAAAVEKANAALKAAGRAAEDALEPVQDAMADRDAADGSLDDLAQNARANLAGRSKDAAREEPYISIFGEGIGYYIAAPADEQDARYRQLVDRVQKHLPAKDPVRVALPKQITAALGEYTKAATSLQKAESAADDATAVLRRAGAAWSRQIERTYGALIAEHGRAAAETYFPRARAATKRAKGKSTEPSE